MCSYFTPMTYWGLRKYSGVPDLVWGDRDCKHRWDMEEISAETWNRDGHVDFGDKNPKRSERPNRWQTVTHERGICSLCGDWKGSYGLEPTPEMYIQHTIEILREIKRVLRKDGVVFWNIGDSYWGGKGQSGQPMDAATQQERHGRGESINQAQHQLEMSKRPQDGKHYSIKPKDLCLIPFKVALEAQKPYQEYTVKSLSDRAWLAGIVDADGCIGIHHYERKWKDKPYHQFQPYISVGCSDREMTDRCAAITRMKGTRSITQPPIDNRGIKSNRPHYEWRVEGENAAKILEDIYPYLIVKEKQARLAHAVWRSNQETRGGRAKPIPIKVTDYRLSLWDSIKKCNQRENINIMEPPVPQHIEPGWWLRSIIIWSKPNPMPESVTDRPTNSHEYILMLTKLSKYYWDADAVREPHTWIEDRPSGMVRQAEQYRGRVKHNDPKYGGGGSGFQGHSGGNKADGTPLNNPAGRNIRSVWEFPTQPYPEAHFAVFPEKLPEICIKAATPEVGCCSKCGAPWERIVGEVITKVRKPERGLLQKHKAELGNDNLRDGFKEKNYRTLGWQPTCKCKADKVPSIVLDPFAGAGTTLWVAKKLGRKAVGYELSEEYCRLIVERNRQQVMI